MDDRSRHDPSIEVNGMLGLVGEMGAAVFHFGDSGVGVGGRSPILVRQGLALALAIEPDQVLLGAGNQSFEKLTWGGDWIGTR